MSPNRVMIIGSGALGKALGLHFFKDEEVRFWGRINRSFSFEGKQIQVYSTEQNQFFKELKEADVIVISTIDGAIKDTIEKIQPFIQKNQRILHVSGTQPITILKSLEDKEAHVGVFHILQTFHQDSYQKKDILFSTAASFVGSDDFFEWLKYYASKQNMHLLKVTDEQKKQLHIAAVFVCNFQHVLFDAARKSANLPEEELFLLLKPLIHQTIGYTTNGGVLTKLSGPVKRGDERTIQAHIDTLQKLPDQQKVYMALTDYLKKAVKYEF
jgi:predicted short-subunit dehydrogenase-like oxidoreductase (DUF2520 family)